MQPEDFTRGGTRNGTEKFGPALCGVLCFWLFALAFGAGRGAAGAGSSREKKAALVSAPTAQETAAAAAVFPDLPGGGAGGAGERAGALERTDERVPIASITKLMTLLLTFEAIHGGKLTLDTLVPVSEHAYPHGRQPDPAGTGEQFTLDEMLRSHLRFVGERRGGGRGRTGGRQQSVFVEQMNARAAELGMTNTSFPQCVRAGHGGTSFHGAGRGHPEPLILNTCPELLHIRGSGRTASRNGQTQLVNTNKLLKRYSGITGLKTGTTSGAGSASGQRHGTG